MMCFQWKMSCLAADIIVRLSFYVHVLVISAFKKGRVKKTLLMSHFLQWRKNDLPVLDAMN